MNLEKRIYVQYIDLYMISTLLANFTGVGHLSNCRVPFADNSSVQCSFSPPFDCISASWERNCLTWRRGWEAIRFGNSHLIGLKPTQSAGPSSFVGKHCPSALFSPDSCSYPYKRLPQVAYNYQQPSNMDRKGKRPRSQKCHLSSHCAAPALSLKGINKYDDAFSGTETNLRLSDPVSICVEWRCLNMSDKMHHLWCWEVLILDETSGWFSFPRLVSTQSEAMLSRNVGTCWYPMVRGHKSGWSYFHLENVLNFVGETSPSAWGALSLDREIVRLRSRIRTNNGVIALAKASENPTALMLLQFSKVPLNHYCSK